jgi:hypothetical protein
MRLAYHEAGHSVGAFLMGCSVGAVSIRPASRWTAVASARVPGFGSSDLARLDVGLPLACWPTRIRRALETHALVALCGPHGERYAPRELGSSGYEVDRPRRRDHDLATATLSPLTAADALLLASGDDTSEPPLPSDLKRAFEAAELAVGGVSESPRAARLIAFLDVEAEAFVASPPFQWRLRPLAEALIEHETLSAGSVNSILTTAMARFVSDQRR